MDILRKQAEFELALRVAGLKFSLFGAVLFMCLPVFAKFSKSKVNDAFCEVHTFPSGVILERTRRHCLLLLGGTSSVFQLLFSFCREYIHENLFYKMQ